VNGPLDDVARTLYRMRLKVGWSQEELARLASVPVDEIVAYEFEPAALSSGMALCVFDAMPPDARDLSLFDSPTLSLPPSPPIQLAPDMDASVHEISAAFAIDKRDFAQALEDLDRLWHAVPARRGSASSCSTRRP
jgi:hypothetical protein